MLVLLFLRKLTSLLYHHTKSPFRFCEQCPKGHEKLSKSPCAGFITAAETVASVNSVSNMGLSRAMQGIV